MGSSGFGEQTPLADVLKLKFEEEQTPEMHSLFAEHEEERSS